MNPKTSEFWLTIAVLAGQAGVSFGWWTQADWDKFLYPAIVYITGRVSSKVAKAPSAKAAPK